MATVCEHCGSKVCEYCGLSKHNHNSAECRISAKADKLLSGCTPHEAGFVVVECADMADVAEKVEAIHTLMT